MVAGNAIKFFRLDHKTDPITSEAQDQRAEA